MLVLGVVVAVVGLVERRPPGASARRTGPTLAGARVRGDGVRASPRPSRCGGSSEHQVLVAYPEPDHAAVADRSPRSLAATVGLVAARGGPGAQAGGRVIELRGITVAYDGTPGAPRRRPRRSATASWCWSPGPTGSGKSTLLGVVTGLVPRFTGGRLSGDLLLDGVSIIESPPRERAHVDRVRRPGPAGRVRDRHRRGGARLRHGAARPAAARRCAAGSRRRSTCSASPTSARATCARCPAASSSGSRSARC